MSAPDVTTVTTTSVNDDNHDGVLPEPDRTFSNILWLLGVGTLAIAILVLTVTICMKALAPADATSDAHLGVLVALLGNMVTGMIGFFVSQRRK